MGYIREIPSGGSPPASVRGSALGELGWTVKAAGQPEGHEKITRWAIGPANTVTYRISGRPASRVLSKSEVDQIIEGNIAVDLGARKWLGTRWGFTDIFTKSEQKRHALRYDAGQTTALALGDITAHLRGLFTRTIQEPDAAARLRRIGETLHLIQDSVSPAHTERQPGEGWCISYIRNFGRGSPPLYGRGPAPREHALKDDRDKVDRCAGAAAQAVALSRSYLEIVFKAIQGRSTGNAAVVAEANGEFNRFVNENYRPCGRSYAPGANQERLCPSGS